MGDACAVAVEHAFGVAGDGFDEAVGVGGVFVVLRAHHLRGGAFHADAGPGGVDDAGDALGGGHGAEHVVHVNAGQFLNRSCRGDLDSVVGVVNGGDVPGEPGKVGAHVVFVHIDILESCGGVLDIII